MVLWNFDLLRKTMLLWAKLWYYGQTIVLHGERNFDLRRKKHGRLPKTKKLGFIME